MPLAEPKNKYIKVSSLEKAHSGWEDEYEVSSKQSVDYGHMIEVVVQRAASPDEFTGLTAITWAEVSRVMDIIINSLYSNKDILL